MKHGKNNGRSDCFSCQCSYRIEHMLHQPQVEKAMVKLCHGYVLSYRNQNTDKMYGLTDMSSALVR
jgi:hypothetical protein